jgi:hypothetical protein
LRAVEVVLLIVVAKEFPGAAALYVDGKLAYPDAGIT